MILSLSIYKKVCTDLEKSLNLTLVLDLSHLSWNLAQMPLKTWIGPGKLSKNQFSLFMGCAKNEWEMLDM